MAFVHDTYDDANRYWSKILHNAIPTPLINLKVNVTDLEFSYLG